MALVSLRARVRCRSTKVADRAEREVGYSFMGRVLDPNALRDAVDAAKASGKKIVFTNGCFDIIHAGHIRYLKEAKRLGDLLVVALNTDRSVSLLKKGRPIIPESERAEVVASLEMVDFVTLFDEATPYALIRLLKPDLLVKGGDWKKEDIVGSDVVPETRSLPYVQGISTTEIIEKIKLLCR
ncbi:MAG TPA: adenylyltransferase/cytidyltransferase family protein [Thermodesulfovibrionales bacterium]|nr:adenylyltransferase/cytidyltransferase family protein [Thermodesulfovibrionales bacterium]